MEEITLSSQIGFLVVMVVLLAAAVVIVLSPLSRTLKVIVVAGLAFHVLGAILRLYVLFAFYHGVGDAVGYFRVGVEASNYIQSFDLSPFVDPRWWSGGRITGTTFIYWFSTIVVSFIGPSIMGEFVVFAMFAFIGLACFVVAFRRSFPTVPFHRYAAWVLLFPSLWYWPSSVGKEALLIMGMGIAVMGIIGERGRIHWLPFLLGTFLVFAVRSQLAAVFLGSALIAYWLGKGARWTVGKTYQAIGVAGISLLVIVLVLRATGLESFDLEGVESYVESGSSRTVGGGSAVAAPVAGLMGIPTAFSNVLFRPFPWEADGLPLALASVEMLLLWMWVIVRRRKLIASLRGWRSSRLLCLSCAFFFTYAVSLGMMVANLGILARQRIFLFPFLFVFLEASVPRRVPTRGRRRPPPVTAGRRAIPLRAGGAPWPGSSPDAPGPSSSP